MEESLKKIADKTDTDAACRDKTAAVSGKETDMSGAQEHVLPLYLLDQMFSLPENDYTQYSPLTLAYIGDAVYDLVIRSILVRRSNMQAVKLHHKASGVVKAQSQAKAILSIQEELTEQERKVFHRGTNAKPPTMSKNASREDYLTATGYEALIGYLYLTRQYDRMFVLIEKGLTASKQVL